MTLRTLTMAGIFALAGALLFPSGLLADEQPEALADDPECPDKQKLPFVQPPIEIGPCNTGQVCWKPIGGGAPTAQSSGQESGEVAISEEPDCKLRGDLYALDIGHFCVWVNNRSYPAQAASYSALAASTKGTEAILVQRNGVEFRWSFSACADLGKCDAGHGGGGNKCEKNGVPRGSQGILIGPFLGTFTLHPKETSCPPGTKKVGVTPTLCAGPVEKIGVRGKE